MKTTDLIEKIRETENRSEIPYFEMSFEECEKLVNDFINNITTTTNITMRDSDEIIQDLQMLEACNELHRKSIKENQPQMELLSLEYDKALQNEAKSVFIANKNGLKEVGKYL